MGPGGAGTGDGLWCGEGVGSVHPDPDPGCRDAHTPTEPESESRSNPTLLCPAQPAKGQHSQVCEIIQGFIRSEHVQQPDDLGNRPEYHMEQGHSGGHGASVTPKLALCSGQESPYSCPHVLPPSVGPGSIYWQSGPALAHMPIDTGYF